MMTQLVSTSKGYPIETTEVVQPDRRIESGDNPPLPPPSPQDWERERPGGGGGDRGGVGNDRTRDCAAG
jgi:hypothetical protein